MPSPTTELRREHSVFINCPFDKYYEPLLDCIFFSTICCGFVPRSSKENETVSEFRINKIKSAIFHSKYSIHELSICRGEGEENLARFNMPLELGICIGQSRNDTEKSVCHEWLGLVPKGHIFKKFISDLSGFDPKEHDCTPESIVPAVVSWLITRPEAIKTLTPKDILFLLETFTKQKTKLSEEWNGQPLWGDLIKCAATIVKPNLATSEDRF
ncbi:MAG: hypothetical protein ABSE00_09540 [Chitinispirillaceae bacterium]|jgi:hypothetical protein